MSSEAYSPPEPESGPEGILLAKLTRRMDRRNHRMLANLSAWAEILDALGWNVALYLPGRDPLLSARARKWAEGCAERPMTWPDLTARLAAAPPARQMVATAQVRVWAEGGTEANDGGMPTPRTPLTQRETEVLAWLREGKTGPEIAAIFGCAQRTVESHVARIYQKLGVHQRAKLLFQTDPSPP